MRQFAHQFRVEQKVFWRNRESAVFIFIFPIMLFVLLASVYGGTIEIDGVKARPNTPCSPACSATARRTRRSRGWRSRS